MERDSCVHRSSRSVTSLKHASLLSDEFTAKEQLSICCKPSFRLRRLRNKGAILVLVWCYLCVSFPSLYLKNGERDHGIRFDVEAVTFSLTLSIAGWIADVYLGRYRVIYLSMWVVWTALVLATVSSVLLKTVSAYTSLIHSYVNVIFGMAMAFGFGAFQANIIQFGIDQLRDASSDEISSFIFWYVWSCVCSYHAANLIFDCLSEQYLLLGNVILCTGLSISLSSMLLCNHWLVKEPVTQNPFKLVYNVIRYAIKHKHAECRSAFTYCEDEPPSRIDFGKSKYGGPFTTEQVEDVKTFLQFIIVLVVGVVTFSAIFASERLLHMMLRMLAATKHQSSSQCYSKATLINTLNFSVIVILCLYEVIFYPLFHRCLGKIKYKWTFILGVLLLISTTLSMITIEIIARYNYHTNNTNATTSCMHYGILSASMDFRWMAVPLVLHSLSTVVCSIGAITLLASQTPHSMRGLIMGVGYCSFSVSRGVGVGITRLFSKHSSIWGTGIISCVFWYALLLLVVEVLVGLAFAAMQKWYKKRKREDVLPNEHIFAERYYDRDSL